MSTGDLLNRVVLAACNSRRCVVAFLAFAAVVVSGCSEPVVVRRVLLDVDPAGVAAGVDREQIRAVVNDVIDHTRGLRVDNDAARSTAERVLRVRIESLARGERPGASSSEGAELATSYTTLTLAVELLEGGRTTLRSSDVAAAPGVADHRALVESALRSALARLLLATGTEKLSSDDLLALLASSTAPSEQQRRAMLALGARGERRATAHIVARLRSDDGETRQAALQALTALADPAAVDAIIEFSTRQPALVRKQCIDAVIATGSPMAAPWLFTLSTGHPDADVQASARAALATLSTAMPLERAN
jgi:hypothetical protein